ncbi:MAG TPA: HlyD family secretion protein [Polyangiaceae bacterium]|jgi:membrane fusion protein (multidrug efflux system)|nr:HlyD family secretion protein [Polyangiaceae bacterium]
MTTSAIDNVLVPTPAAPAKKRSRALTILPLLVAAAVGTGALVYVAGHGKETTDDAQVEGHVASVAPRVAGQVQRVLVRDNQRVAAGDVLVELDDRDFAVKLSAAQADLEAAKAQLHAAETQLSVTAKTVDSNLLVARGGVTQAQAVRGTTRAAIEQARAEITAAASRQTLARAEQTRARTLFASGAVAQAELDAKQTALEQADAQLVQAQAHLTSAEANIDNSSGTLASARGRLVAAESGPEQIEAARAQVGLGRARVAQASAAVAQAELNLGYTKIRAELPGIVSRRSVEVGQLASPERPMLAIVPLDDTWVVANFKEDQIAEMRSGQPATVSIDSLAGQKLVGHVDSLASGTGARFSLLPPDNASGNFTKVVQRVPVLVRLEPHPGFELRPGLSATVTISTRQ